MKSSLQFLAVLGGSLTLIVGGTTFLVDQPEAHYQPTIELTSNHKARSWNGAAEHYHRLVANKETGGVDARDVIAAREALDRLSGQRNLGTSWVEMGPENIGGRTRAILVDKANSQHIFAGAVSGGLFESNNAGGLWAPHPDIEANLIVSCITQAANGDIYVGTGSSFEQFGQPLFPGIGIYKSTDGGQSFSLLSSTNPGALSRSVDWAAVNKIVTDPANPTRVYAAINRGVRYSSDGGATWSHAMRIANCQIEPNQAAQDVEITADGRLIVVFKDSYWYSDNPTDPCSYTEVSAPFPNVWGRMEVAVAPSNEDRMYALVCDNNGAYQNIFVSDDMGSSWAVHNPGPDVNDPNWDLFGEFGTLGTGGQGVYDMALAVDPLDDERFFIAGVQMYRFDGNWTQASGEHFSQFSPFYVHADKHTIVFDPNNPLIMYIGSDGGVAKSFDAGITFTAANRGFNVTQFYSIGISNNELVIGGTQDNGTLIINPNLMGQEKDGIEVLGGDGFDAEISQITGAQFGTLYFSNVYRSNGASGMSQILGDITLPNGPFATVLRLWESENDLTSKDSITFEVDTSKINVKVGNGSSFNYAGTVGPEQTAGEVIPGTVSFIAGTQKLVTNPQDINELLDANGNTAGSLAYNSDGTIDYQLSFPQAPGVNQLIFARFLADYQAGDVLSFFSETGNIPIEYTLTSNLSFGQSIKVQDPVQSLLTASVSNNGGMAITRGGLRFGQQPTWINFNPSQINGVPICFEYSPNGDHLYVGTDDGRVHRISGLNDLYTQSDVNNLTVTPIFNAPSNQTVTGIAVNPSDPNIMAVTLGNYGHNDYVFLLEDVESALNPVAANPRSIQSQLPKMPVYDAEFIVGQLGTLVLGTEYGVFSATDVFANVPNLNPTWAEENDNLPRCPVYQVRQQKLDFTGAGNHGVLYLATHGRGIWKTGFFVGFDEPGIGFAGKVISNLKVYPNPMKQEGFIRLESNGEASADIFIHDLQGRMVKTFNTGRLSLGENNIPLPVADLSAGTYFAVIKSGEASETAKFIVTQ